MAAAADARLLPSTRGKARSPWGVTLQEGGRARTRPLGGEPDGKLQNPGGALAPTGERGVTLISKGKITSFANRDSFTSSFATWTTLISFSSLIVLVRKSSVMTDERGNLKEEAPSLLSALAVNFFVVVLYQAEEVPVSSYFLSFFFFQS